MLTVYKIFSVVNYLYYINSCIVKAFSLKLSISSTISLYPFPRARSFADSPFCIYLTTFTFPISEVERRALTVLKCPLHAARCKGVSLC